MRLSGIAGILGLPADECTEDLMFLSLKHRGPDHSAGYRWKDNLLLQTDHARSALEGAHPFTLDWAGEQYAIVFDGQIYNREELQSELSGLGDDHKEISDAELMLRGYICWQEKVVNMVNGVFAMAIAHERKGRVFLARDRIGVRPLFYKCHNGGLLFGSEIKTILAYPDVQAELDVQGAAEILLLGPGRIPGSGVFKGIFEIEPGQYAVYEGGNLRLHRYWQLRDTHHSDTLEETVDKVRLLVLDAVRRQMPTNETVGTMLSGGLDSSLISAICARELDARGKRLDTFSLDYQDNAKFFQPGRFQPNLDTEYIRIMQSQLDSMHHWTVLTPDILVDEISNATIARDLPGMADIDTSLLAFCRQIKQHTDIVLSGECADEIFGGYPWYRDPEMRDRAGFPWSLTIGERTGFLQGWIADAFDPNEFVHEYYLQSIRQADILPDNSPQERRIKELVNLNFRWFMQTLLDRGDRMGNLTGLEIRVPLCDYRIAEYLYTVPWGYKDHKGYEKGLLRKAMEGILPQSVLYRKKSPFPKTYDPAYLEIVSQMLRTILKDPSAPIFQLIRRESLEHLLQQEFAWPWYGQLMRRPQTIVYMLQINYWLEHYSVRIV